MRPWGLVPRGGGGQRRGASFANTGGPNVAGHGPDLAWIRPMENGGGGGAAKQPREAKKSGRLRRPPANSQGQAKQPKGQELKGSRAKKGTWGEAADTEPNVVVAVAGVVAVPVSRAAVVGFVEPRAAAQQLGDPPMPP